MPQLVIHLLVIRDTGYQKIIDRFDEIHTRVSYHSQRLFFNVESIYATLLIV